MDTNAGEDLKKSFQHLQAKRLQTQQSVQQADALIQAQEKKLKKLSIIRGEVLCPIPKSNLFLGIGRMYIDTSEKEICRVLDDATELATNTLELLKVRLTNVTCCIVMKSYVKRNRKSFQANEKFFVKPEKKLFLSNIGLLEDAVT
ncbi:prefoldin subunit 1 [Trichuris trichiura]|uniref:Prefoldin subunit 1 n=1 Tax=Trichuris trichiura TaxID=36087 RepID=A0A077YVE8_TRITR|nr:prefoldin subunit 1 [Trichuris trichiura]